MLHKIYSFFGLESNKSLEEKEQEVADFMDNITKDNVTLIQENEELREMIKEKDIPPLKVALRETRKRRPWCWGLLMILMAFIQAILVASGKQRSARRHLIGLLKELEYYYGFRFVAIEENEPPDERKD